MLKRKKLAPDGSKDENVFDIQQGVSINIFIKPDKTSLRGNSKRNPFAKVYHADLYGLRQEKYNFLNTHNLGDIKWQELKTEEPNFFFVPKNFALKDEYEKGFRIDEFIPIHASGIKFRKDNLLVKNNYSLDDTKQMVYDVITLEKNEVLQKYDFLETSDW